MNRRQAMRVVAAGVVGGVGVGVASAGDGSVVRNRTLHASEIVLGNVYINCTIRGSRSFGGECDVENVPRFAYCQFIDPDARWGFT